MTLVAAACGIIAVGFAIAAVTTWRSQSSLASRGLETSATVAQVDDEPQGTSSITVRFTDASGATLDETLSVSGSPPPQGTAERVRYDPQDPTNIELTGPSAASGMGAASWLGIAGLFAAIALASLLVRFFALWAGRRRELP